MATTYLEILDTTIKIGLGALISGITTWRITKLQHRNDDEKQKKIRRIENLELVAEQVEVFSHHAMIYWTRIVDFTRRQENNIPHNEEQLKELRDARANVYGSYKNLNSAESKLLLLGLTESQQTLRSFGQAVSIFYAEIYIGNHGKSLEEVKKWREDLLENRRIFFKYLSLAYTLS
ncbi:MULTISPECIES: hypothetical protein [Aeromonas]|uniref:hypothetical protein n=1 Tax=Aeromonas TaxID=642 RepID=UPI0011187544|nr:MULTISPECIES: hypothetical protein [Aeromonas]EKP0303540.1 hypothetical protein [Aeromonas veronii]MCF7744241.1 hypothetical protein [Aeromonas veronii]NJI21634.1 hypothetical protein [Aeromonas veronii]NJI35495.1 hypothetical protein [Aeromonas veronii]QWZ82636.1 hypothetical protein I6L44_06995 [Aeromonas sp. FDAARGOS 1414]